MAPFTLHRTLTLNLTLTLTINVINLPPTVALLVAYKYILCEIKRVYLIYRYNYGTTRSVATTFGRHGMPPPASNDTGTKFCFPNYE